MNTGQNITLEKILPIGSKVIIQKTAPRSQLPVAGTLSEAGRFKKPIRIFEKKGGQITSAIVVVKIIDSCRLQILTKNSTYLLCIVADEKDRNFRMFQYKDKKPSPFSF